MKKFLFLLSTVLLALTLVSCDNFLDNFLEGSDLQKEVDRYITIANAEKPALISKTPAYTEDGVFKNTSITLTLSHKIEEKNFRFTNDELISLGAYDSAAKLNSGYNVLKDNNGKVYAYTFQKQTFFKNITILDSTNSSLCSMFTAPVVSYNATRKETLIQITVDEFAIPDFTGLMSIQVTFSKDIEDSETIPVTTDISWRYNIKNEFEKEKPVLYKNNLVAALNKEDLEPEGTPDSKKDQLRSSSYADCYVTYFNNGEGIEWGDNYHSNYFTSLDKFVPARRPVFFEGGIPDFNAASGNKELSNFFHINHINDKAYFYIQGYDQGSETINAIIKWNRITDESGDTVQDNIPQEYLTSTAILEKNKDSTVLETVFELNLNDENLPSEFTYQDGLYKLEIQLQDAQDNLSDEKAVYYLVRDTKVNFPMDMVSFSNQIPEMIADYNETTKDTDDYTNVRPTPYSIHDRRKVVNFENTQDDYFYTYKKGNKEAAFYTTNDRYIITFDFGTSPDNILKKDLPFEVNQWGPEKNMFEFIISNTFFDAFADYPDSNIYLKVNFKDEAGNVASMGTYFPAYAKVTNYNYDQANQKIKLNVTRQDGIEWSSILNLETYNPILRYRVYYAETSDNVNLTNDTVIYKRNINTEYAEYSDIESDYFEFPVVEGKTYSAFILPIFYMMRKSDGWLASTLEGPLTIINNIKTVAQTSQSIVKPSFTISKKNNGINSGTFTITATLDKQKIETDTEYLLSYSTDGGETYTYLYDALDTTKGTITSIIPTPVIPPVYSKWTGTDYNNTDSWLYTKYGFWQDYIEATGQLEDHIDSTYGHKVFNYMPENNKDPITGEYLNPYSPYENIVKFKIIAVKNKSAVESDEVVITFTDNEDNKAPYFDTWNKSHNILLTPDGQYLTSASSVINDDEWHLDPSFTFYYTPYKDYWGNNLHVLTDKEISKLPSGKGYLKQDYISETEYFQDKNYAAYKDENDFTVMKGVRAKVNSFIKIPVAGIPSGDYMFFGKFTDSKGNYTYETLGKASINSFDEKPQVAYGNDKITVNFSPKTNDFDENIVGIRYYSKTSSNNWTELLPEQAQNHYLNIAYLTKSGNSLSYTSDSITEKNTFYRVQTQSSNIDITTSLYWKIDDGNGYWAEGTKEIDESITASDIELRRKTMDLIYSWQLASDEINDLKGFIHNYTGTDSYTIELKNKKNDKNEWSIDDNDIMDYFNIKAAETNFLNNDLKDIVYRITRRLLIEEISDHEAYDYYTNETTSYPVFKYITDSTTSYADDTKNFIDGSYGAMLLCSQPALVEFITCDYDLGESIDEWELNGTVTDTQFYNDPDFYSSYTASSLTMLSSDAIKQKTGPFYYVVTVHFADGTENISRVYKK